MRVRRGEGRSTWWKMGGGRGVDSTNLTDITRRGEGRGERRDRNGVERDKGAGRGGRRRGWSVCVIELAAGGCRLWVEIVRLMMYPVPGTVRTGVVGHYGGW